MPNKRSGFLDLRRSISELNAYKRQLQHVIDSLEAISGADVKTPRGRKSMGPEERKQVSKRMKEFWAKRRAGKKSG